MPRNENSQGSPSDKMRSKHQRQRSWTYCGWTKSCTTWKPWKSIVCSYLQGNYPSRVSEVVRNGSRPSKVLVCRDSQASNSSSLQPSGHLLQGGFCPKLESWPRQILCSTKGLKYTWLALGVQPPKRNGFEKSLGESDVALAAERWEVGKPTNKRPLPIQPHKGKACCQQENTIARAIECVLAGFLVPQIVPSDSAGNMEVEVVLLLSPGLNVFPLLADVLVKSYIVN